MKKKGIFLILVIYNVMLDVYGKMGWFWDKIVGFLDEIISKGLIFDEFICSIVIVVCGREGLLDEVRRFFF